MCGISGIWNLNQKFLEPVIAKKFNDSLNHRGTDNSGIYKDEQTQISLGHCRLSIIDLSSAGHQPMICTDNNFVITYNGEIYNHEELRSELIIKGHKFYSRTDTEVILAAYKEWGIDCQYKFNGMWAFAIWNISDKTLFISRDRFGVKPLYYLYKPNILFAFASETIAFKHLIGYERIESKKNINLGIRDPFYLESVGETLHQNILKLKAGHFLVINKNGELKIDKWWSTEKNLVSIPEKYNDQVEYFKELFIDACKIRLRSDVPVGIALSGGLDSSSVYSTIQHLNNNKSKISELQTAFVASFPGTTIDEKAYADEVINYHQGKAKYIYPNEIEICDSIYKETKAGDFIYLSPPVVQSIYYEMRKSNTLVSLDGHGADELLFGYSGMIADLFNSSTNGYKEDIGNTWANVEGRDLKQAKEYLKNSVSHKKRSFIRNAYDILPDYIKRTYRRQVFRKNINNSWLLEFNEFKRNCDTFLINNTDPFFTIPYRNFHGGMMLTILRNWDIASMRNGVEIRMPFLDWRLVTYIFSLPPNAKIKNGFSKVILRDAMKDLMPENIRLRKNKISINAPVQEWFNGLMSDFILDAVNSRSFIESDIWNGKLLRDYATNKTLEKKWTMAECNSFWPYLNAWILLN